MKDSLLLETEHSDIEAILANYALLNMMDFLIDKMN